MCQQLPVRMSDATAVWHRDKLYVRGCVSGTSTLSLRRDSARLYIYIPATDTWDTPIDTASYLFALTTYHSQLVLVGGREYVSENVMGNITNKLWTLSEHGQWQEPLPPMRTKCHSACAMSYGDHLLVAGGVTLETGISNFVEVYNGNHWSFAQTLPISYRDLKSAILDQHWYLMGGVIGHLLSTYKYNTAVHYASIDSLIASCQPSEISQPSSVWKRLTGAPHIHSSTAVFGGRLIAVGGKNYPYDTLNIHAYSFQTNSWIHVGDTLFKSSNTCSLVLPTGELMVVGIQKRGGMRGVVKATIKGNYWV